MRRATKCAIEMRGEGEETSLRERRNVVRLEELRVCAARVDRRHRDGPQGAFRLPLPKKHHNHARRDGKQLGCSRRSRLIRPVFSNHANLFGAIKSTSRAR